MLPTGGDEYEPRTVRTEGSRLEAVANRTEEEARSPEMYGEASGRRARAQEMRVAALLVREEALAVSEEVPRAGSPEA